MKRKVALVLNCVVCAVLPSGCGLTSSPAEGLAFTAPSGWQSSPGIMGFAQLWTPGSNSDEVLMLFRSPREIDRSQVFQSGKLKNTKIDREQEVKICGNQPATYFVGSAESTTGGHPDKPHHLEVMTTNANGATYFAMYVYPMNQQPNAQAQTALHELCVKH